MSIYNSSKEDVAILLQLSEYCKERAIYSFNGDTAMVSMINQNMLKLVLKRGRKALKPNARVNLHPMYHTEPENALTEDWLHLQKIRYVLG